MSGSSGSLSFSPFNAAKRAQIATFRIMGVHEHVMTQVTLKSSTFGSYINHCGHVWFKLVIFMNDAKEKSKNVEKILAIKQSVQVQEVMVFLF